MLTVVLEIRVQTLPGENKYEQILLSVSSVVCTVHGAAYTVRYVFFLTHFLVDVLFFILKMTLKGMHKFSIILYFLL